MVIFYIAAGIIGVLSSILAALEPSRDELRLRRARRELRKSGVNVRRGSEEEARALRILLDGDSLSNI